MKMRAVVVKLVTKFSACYEQVLAQMTSKGHVVLVNVKPTHRKHFQQGSRSLLELICAMNTQISYRRWVAPR